MELLHRQDFSRATGQEFDVHVGDATMTMTLVGIEPHRTPKGSLREAFSLTFRSASPVILPQRIYAMRNRSLAGAALVDVFIVPVGRDAGGMLYQAVFN